MAKTIEAFKPEQDRMSIFSERVHSFDHNAPLSTCKVDRYIAALSSRRNIALDVLKIRKQLWRAAYVSILHENHVRNDHPAWVSEAAELLGRLTALAREIDALQSIDVHHLARVLVHFHDDGQILEPHQNVEAVGDSTRSILKHLAGTGIRLRTYLDHTVLPAYGRSSNHTDHFVQTFALRSAEAWRRDISANLDSKRDRRDFVGLLGTALDDFGYPRSGIQVGSDDWLYQRVGKYDIWN